MDSLILHKGHVTHIIDPSSFWMRMGTDADFQEFDDYQNTLNKYYNETGRTDNVSADTLTQGDCVVVAESGQRQISDDDDEVNTDFHWNRARVSRMDVDKVDVFYIDLGYTEIVHMSRVKNVNRELFDYFPSQVIQLRLAGIRPLARSWTSRALNMFESRVLDQEVLVSLIDYDEVSKYGQVVIYTQQSPCKWRCVTHEMLDEDLGLPLAPMPEEFLSQEVVLAALARGEQDSSRSSCGLDNSRNDSAGGVLNETDSRKNLLAPDPGQSVPDAGQSVSSSEAGQRLTPDSFSTSTSPDHSSASCESAAALVPAFDLSSLVRTKSLSVAKMQEDKVEEQRLLTRARLQQELEDSEEEDGDEQEIDWGKSDLLIGEAGVFSDFDCIRQEIYKHHSDHRRDDDLNDFFYNVTGIHNATPLANSSVVEEQRGKEDTQRGSSEKDLKPLTEMEDYAIEKKIEEILLGKDSGELNMVCVLINSIIEPDVTVPCDRLVAVFTAIIETVVRNPDVDPLIAFGALETYLGTPAFDIALETVLKSLRSSFVKMSRNTQRSNCHRAFTEFLVMLFIRSGNWPLCSCSLVHEFVMASLERWVVFNKQRMQTSDSSMDVEQVYLKCVEVLIDGAGERLHQNCPDRYCLLLEEIKHKLLHDSTQRIIKEQLLNILLKLHTQVTWSTPKTTSERRGVGVQTEACLDHSSTKDSEGSVKTYVAVEEDMKTANDIDSYGLEEDCLNTYGCSDMSSSGWSDEDSDAGTRSLSSADTILAIHSLKRADSIPDINSLASVAGCDIADFDSKTSSAPVAYGASSHSLLTAGNNTRLPRAVQRVPPHVQRNISQDHSFKDEITAVGRSDDSQQKASNELNAFVGELTFSASQNALEQKGKKPAECGRSLEAHVTKGDRHDLNDSKLLGGNTLKQTAVQRLNISAPEFTPKLSGSWAQLDQVKMSACSIDVPEYEADTGLASVKPSGGTNSGLIKPINRDMENERNIEEGLLFVEVGNEKGLGQQKNVSGNIDEIDTSGNIDEIDTSGNIDEIDTSDNIDEIDTSVALYFSDLEALSEHGSPSPENAVESVEMNILDNRIKYTAQELKALNLGASAHLIDADLPRESSLADTVVQKADNQFDKQPAEDLTSSPSAIPCLRYTGRGGSPLKISVGPKSNSAKWKSLSELLPPSFLKPRPHTVEQSAADLTSSPSAIPCLRYTGRGGSPLEISVGPKSNSAKWKSLSELLPPSCLKPHPHTLETSAPPGPFSCETPGNAVLHATEKADQNSLYSHAKSLFPTKDQSVPEKAYMCCNEMNTVSNAVLGDTIGKEDISSADNAEATIVQGRGDVTDDVPQWPETFFRSVGAVEDTTQSTSVDVSSYQTGKSKAKKKMKFRPASEVLAGKSDHDYDEKAAAVSDLNDKECRNEIEESEVGGHVIHQPKLGALCSSSSKRSSWSAELRQEKPRSDKWVPGRRKCTRCGSTDHTIYDCTQEDPYRKPSNQIYFM